MEYFEGATFIGATYWVPRLRDQASGQVGIRLNRADYVRVLEIAKAPTSKYGPKEEIAPIGPSKNP